MKKIILGFLLTILAFITAAAIGLAKTGYRMFTEALENKSLSEAVSEIREQKSFTPIDKLPDTYTNAVVAVEDHRFFSHNGIDLISIARAAWRNIVSGELAESGSTITQQLAKNMFFSGEKSFARKAAELFMAVRIESEYSKEEILELYVNCIYFGNGYYCVKDACEGYFDKPPENMNEYECTMLAGIPNAPSIYAPTENIKLAEERQAQVVESMVRCGYISDNEAEDIVERVGADAVQSVPA